MQLFFVGLASAIGIKLTSSVDDVLWLAPFLTANVNPTVRLQNATVYIAVCLIQTVVAMVIAASGTEAVAWLTGGAKDAWSTDKILTVVAGVLLALYTVKLTYEYVSEMMEGGEEEEGSEAEGNEEETEEEGVIVEMELGLSANHKKGLEGNDEIASQELLHSRKSSVGGEDDEAREITDKKRQQTLFVIAFIGSLDDLTLFVPMLVGKGFDMIQLLCGALIAASTIVIICLCLGRCKPVADCLGSIPLAAIVAAFATVLLVKGLTME